MGIKKINKLPIFALIVYLTFVVFIFLGNETELQDKLRCCGLYDYYSRYYLPLPIIESDELAVRNWRPTLIYFYNIIIDILLPIFVYISSKSFISFIKKKDKK